MPQSLSGLAEVADVPWDKVFVFFSDERCVALDHPDSNYLACKIHFLDKVSYYLSIYLSIYLSMLG